MSNAHHPSHELGYLYRRAEQELEQAQRAAHPAAVKAHYDLASSYLERIHDADGITPAEGYGGADQPTDREARPEA